MWDVSAKTHRCMFELINFVFEKVKREIPAQNSYQELTCLENNLKIEKLNKSVSEHKIARKYHKKWKNKSQV